MPFNFTKTLKNMKMGNTSKKLAEKCTILTKDEQKMLAVTFRPVSRNSPRVREDDLVVSGTLDALLLEKVWGPQIDPRLAQYLSNFLFGFGPNKSETCDFNRFAELYVFNVRGNPDERMTAIYNCLGKQFDDSEVEYQLVKEYCESIASTYIKMLKSNSQGVASQWVQKGFQGKARHVQALGEAVAAGISDCDPPPATVTSSHMSKWLSYETLLRELSQLVFSTLYGTSKQVAPSCLPAPDGLSAMPDYPAFIDLSHIVWVNAHLPRPLQHKWRFLFSSHIHGESFSTLAGRIIDQGPSIIIIEDKSGYIFGGYAAQAWNINPNFYGKEESFLFTLAPKMRVYNSSGFNNHYQYINNFTKTLPNGIIMGGQFEFGAIWLPADPFGEGSSAESCTTYRGYRRLSKERDFKIKSLEVWGVGDKPVSLKDDEEGGEGDGSILDKNPEAKAILDLAGKTRHSDGIREPVD
ncbi:MTOR-associated protein MEAK7 isoform X2 [Plutella xylostella]|uniref:MTOR-associated protein MEAK7 isoform X1 n=2 Tax=Plutella xylostella TaxID=51655 RepID=UPI00203269A5|nr:MTOR-associated protein MEAK7 isoform X1 [Plutella xylostella]XP_048484111.1 MTOR-associated protein MEAK7 isoform X2 [Plutella xylostella]